MYCWFSVTRRWCGIWFVLYPRICIGFNLLSLSKENSRLVGLPCCLCVCLCVFYPFSFWTSSLIFITFWCECYAIGCHPNLVLLISLSNKNMVGAPMRSEVVTLVILNVWCGYKFFFLNSISVNVILLLTWKQSSGHMKSGVSFPFYYYNCWAIVARLVKFCVEMHHKQPHNSV
jgi:hypothetical protein